MTNSVDKPIRSEIVLYQTEDSKTRLEVRLENETVWLAQSQMAELFQTSIPNVSMHIRNIFREGELREDSVVKDFLTTAADGKRLLHKGGYGHCSPSGPDSLKASISASFWTCKEWVRGCHDGI